MTLPILFPSLFIFATVLAIVSGNEHPPVYLKKIIVPKRPDVANITRSIVDNLLVDSLIGFGFTIPRNKGVKFSFGFSVSLQITGFIGEELDGRLQWLSKNVSERMGEFFQTEKKNLKRRAGSAYFSWLQAAANFGYTDDEYTRRVMKRNRFREFNRRAAGVLRRLKEERLTAKVKVRVSGVSNGQRSLFAYIRTNTIVLTNGKTITFVRKKPLVTIASETGDQVDVSQSIVSFSKTRVKVAHKEFVNSASGEEEGDDFEETPSPVM